MLRLQLDAASGRGAASGRARARRRRQRRRRRMPADGRRLRRQGEPAGLFACVAALFAQKPGGPVKLRLDRDDDMMITGKRHDFVTDYDVGFDGEGRILGVELHARRPLRLLGRPLGVDQRPRDVPQRQLLLPRRTSASLRYRCKTNTLSNTAFRGFGGPQGMIGHRARDRRHRAPARTRSARRAQGSTSTARPSATSRTTSRRSTTT